MDTIVPIGYYLTVQYKMATINIFCKMLNNCMQEGDNRKRQYNESR